MKTILIAAVILLLASCGQSSTDTTKDSTVVKIDSVKTTVVDTTHK